MTLYDASTKLCCGIPKPCVEDSYTPYLFVWHDTTQPSLPNRHYIFASVSFISDVTVVTVVTSI